MIIQSLVISDIDREASLRCGRKPEYTKTINIYMRADKHNSLWRLIELWWKHPINNFRYTCIYMLSRIENRNSKSNFVCDVYQVRLINIYFCRLKKMYIKIIYFHILKLFHRLGFTSVKSYHHCEIDYVLKTCAFIRVLICWGKYLKSWYKRQQGIRPIFTATPSTQKDQTETAVWDAKKKVPSTKPWVA